MADKTVTVKPSGQGGTYENLAAAIAGELTANAKLTPGDGGLDGILNIDISGTWSSADTTAVNVNGFTTDATHYVNIYTTAAARFDPNGPWDAGAYNLTTNNATALSISDDYVRLDGLQIRVGGTINSANRHNISISEIAATNNDIRISNCILWQHGYNYEHGGVYINDTDAIVKIWNTIGYGAATGLSFIRGVYANCSELSIYNCTWTGGRQTLSVIAGTVVAKNVYCGGGGNGDFYRGGGSLAKTNCASSDETATATGTGVTASNCINSVAHGTATFTNVTEGSQNYHLAGTGSALYRTGVDTSGEAAPLDFDTDIDGDAYYDTGGARSIGADEYVAAASSAVNIVYNII